MLIDASINSASTMSDSSARSESSRANPRDEVELVDTHAHLNFDAFEKDADEVIRRCLDGSTGASTELSRMSSPQVWMINVGSHYESSQKAIEIAQKYPEGVYAAIGLHPINLDTGLMRMKKDEIEGCRFEREFDYEKYKKLALSGVEGSKKVIAIGEIGLDYYWRPKTTAKKELFKQKQKDLLLKQLELAKELNLPIIFHCRVAHDDLIEILREQQATSDKKIRGVTHGFVGSLEQLKEYLKMGFYIGYNGIIFKKIEGINFEENIKNTPLERILVETDCPYLVPPVSVSQRVCQRESASIVRNEPLNVKYVAQEIAKIKNLSYKEITEITTQNAKKLFGI